MGLYGKSVYSSGFYVDMSNIYFYVDVSNIYCQKSTKGIIYKFFFIEQELLTQVWEKLQTSVAQLS